jgi:serine/threonine protein kinase
LLAKSAHGDTASGSHAPKAASSLTCSQIKLEKSLGDGGRGEVHQAHCHKRLVAARRVLPHSMKQVSIEELQAEVAALVEMKHPNLLKVLGVATDTSPIGGAWTHSLILSELCDYSLEQAVVGNKLGTCAALEPWTPV